jgi:hypothetical protein
MTTRLVRSFHHCCLFALFIAVFCTVPLAVLARSVTTIVAKEGEPVGADMARHYGWSDGTLGLINHRLRWIGWHYSFAMNAGDETHYAFRAKQPEQVQEIVESFAQLEASAPLLILDPRREPPSGTMGLIRTNNNVAAVFSIGSQKIVDDWYRQLPKDPSGNRKSGKETYAKPPVARGPRLILYVAGPAVVLSQIKLPLRVNVIAPIADSLRKEHANDPVLQKIDLFVLEHSTKQEAAKKRATEP